MGLSEGIFDVFGCVLVFGTEFFKLGIIWSKLLCFGFVAVL